MGGQSRGSATAGTLGLLIDYTPAFWAIAIVFFVFGDLLTTGLGLTSQRVVEVGPLAYLATQHYGLVVAFPLKLVSLGFVYVIWRVTPPPYDVGVPLGLACLGVIVTLWNTAILFAVL